MAIKPNDGEIFLREVDEELRRDRVNRIVARYGWAIVAGIILILSAIGGFIWWQNRQLEQAGAQGEALLEAIESSEGGNRNAATPKINELAESDVEGYRVAALFARATAQSEANDNAAAIATLGSISGNADFAEPYRQAALIRQTALEFDRLKPDEVIARMDPLAAPGGPWFGSAGELKAVALIKQGKKQEAGRLFAAIANDRTVPDTLRARSVQIASTLGVDASAALGAPAQ